MQSIACDHLTKIRVRSPMIETIKTIEPNIIVKGGDYTIKTVVGHEIANVVIFPTIKGHSTTKIIDEIRK